jgi:hypothetical protein
MSDTDTVYRGERIYWHTVPHPDGQPQLVCSVRNWSGIWNSEQAAKDYIDWVLQTRGRYRT